MPVSDNRGQRKSAHHISPVVSYWNSDLTTHHRWSAGTTYACLQIPLRSYGGKMGSSSLLVCLRRVQYAGFHAASRKHHETIPVVSYVRINLASCMLAFDDGLHGVGRRIDLLYVRSQLMCFDPLSNLSQVYAVFDPTRTSLLRLLKPARARPSPNMVAGLGTVLTKMPLAPSCLAKSRTEKRPNTSNTE